MHSNTKLGNNDNGAVFSAEEAVLSGVASNRPQDICTKYPEICSNLEVEADDCGPTCCNNVVVVDTCSGDTGGGDTGGGDGAHVCQGTELVIFSSATFMDNGKVMHKIRILNDTPQPIDLQMKITGTAPEYAGISASGDVITRDGQSAWLYDGRILQCSETEVNIFTFYRGESLTCEPTFISDNVQLSAYSTLTSTDVP